jgi:hypothetical protein
MNKFRELGFIHCNGRLQVVTKSTEAGITF